MSKQILNNVIFEDKRRVVFKDRPALEQRSDMVNKRRIVGVSDFLKQAVLLRIILDHTFNFRKCGDVCLILGFKRFEVIIRSRKKVSALGKPDRLKDMFQCIQLRDQMIGIHNPLVEVADSMIHHEVDVHHDRQCKKDYNDANDKKLNKARLLFNDDSPFPHYSKRRR